MIEIEKIMSQKRLSVNLNVNEFISKLNDRIETSKTNRQIFFVKSLMVIIILLLTVTQFGPPNLELDNYLQSRTENLIETDFWNLNTYSPENEEEYFNNMTYFLIDEGYIWEAVELLYQFKSIEEESL